jgi:hypothetical protein
LVAVSVQSQETLRSGGRLRFLQSYVFFVNWRSTITKRDDEPFTVKCTNGRTTSQCTAYPLAAGIVMLGVAAHPSHTTSNVHLVQRHCQQFIGIDGMVVGSGISSKSGDFAQRGTLRSGVNQVLASISSKSGDFAKRGYTIVISNTLLTPFSTGLFTITNLYNYFIIVSDKT